MGRAGEMCVNMGYCVRLLTPSENKVPFQAIREQVDTVKLISGGETDWEKIEISRPDGALLAAVERYPLSPDNRAESEIAIVKDALQGSYPLNAREWLKTYLSGTRAVYVFRLQAESYASADWPLLGRVQNLLKDRLGGIIQADKEGFYNEDGNYILWQMYDGAAGSVPAAVLTEKGEWAAFQLRLNDAAAVDCFKQGLPPAKGFMDRLLGR
jgi:hypothetical protein